MKYWLLTLAIVLSVAGCGSDEVAGPNGGAGSGGSAGAGGSGGAGAAAGVVTLGAAPYTATVATAPFGVDIQNAGQTVLRFDSASLVLGQVEQVDDSTNYDPYPLLTDGPALLIPVGLEWLPVESAEVTAQSPSGVTLRLTHSAGQLSTFSLQATASGRFAARLVPVDGSRIAYLRVSPQVDSSEAFYGLGEYFDVVNHRGQVRAMQIIADGSIESSYNEAHVPIPLLIGTRGWGLFAQSSYPAAFDVAAAEADRVAAVYGTGTETASAGLDFSLFLADHPLDITRHYYDVTGYPKLPAPWALGPWIWRNENVDQAQIEGDLSAIRDLDLATNGYWIDRPYATAVNTFDWSAAMFDDPARMFDTLSQLGFRWAIWHTPYLDEKDAATAALVSQAESSGYYPPETGINLNRWGRPLDFTNPAAVSWWQDNLQGYVAQGVAGFKLDYAEDIVPGLLGARSRWSFADGSDERTMHQDYQALYHSTYAKLLEDKQGGLLLCRAGTAGDQRNGVIIWPGDLDASFYKHRERVREDGKSYVSVGGLPAAVTASLTLGPSGFPFFGSDTGGYRHRKPDKELFIRWAQHTALSTVMQVGNGQSSVPWEFDAATGYDQELLDIYREYARLHLRLWPYEWTHATRIADTGRPIQRPLGLAYPELGQHPSDEYLFGDDLLVAPVIERGARQRQLYLPPGRWLNWWTGEVLEGPGQVTVAAPLDRLPLFLREGGVVPLLRPTIDSLVATTDTARVDSYATRAGVLHARVALSPTSGGFDVFDSTRIGFARRSQGFDLTYTPGSAFNQGAQWEVIALNKPTSVGTLTERASLPELEAADGWFYDGAGRVLYVRTLATTAQSLSVSLPGGP